MSLEQALIVPTGKKMRTASVGSKTERETGSREGRRKQEIKYIGVTTCTRWVVIAAVGRDPDLKPINAACLGAYRVTSSGALLRPELAKSSSRVRVILRSEQGAS